MRKMKLHFIDMEFSYRGAFYGRFLWFFYSIWNLIGGVMVSVIAAIVVDRGFEPRSAQTKDYEIGMCCFSAKHAAIRRKNKDWLARNQNSVSKWSDISTRRPHHHLIEN